MKLKKNVFMVMPFGDSVADTAYTRIIRPLCESLNLDIVRADEIPSNQVIYDDIIQGIQDATIVIVDISGKNPNVMYELGVAHTLKKTSTVMLTHDPVGQSPFDIQHFRIIPYSDSIEAVEELSISLRNMLEALLGNHQIASKNEFEFCVEFYNSMNKSGDLIGFLGLAKSNITHHANAGASWIGTDERKTQNSSAVSSVGNFVSPFESLFMAEIRLNTVQITDKGRAFARYLEERGFQCEKVSTGSSNPFLDSFLMMNPEEKPSTLSPVPPDNQPDAASAPPPVSPND